MGSSDIPNFDLGAVARFFSPSRPNKNKPLRQSEPLPEQPAQPLEKPAENGKTDTEITYSSVFDDVITVGPQVREVCHDPQTGKTVFEISDNTFKWVAGAKTDFDKFLTYLEKSKKVMSEAAAALDPLLKRVRIIAANFNGKTEPPTIEQFEYGLFIYHLRDGQIADIDEGWDKMTRDLFAVDQDFYWGSGEEGKKLAGEIETLRSARDRQIEALRLELFRAVKNLPSSAYAWPFAGCKERFYL